MREFSLFGGVRVVRPDKSEVTLGRKPRELLGVLVLCANSTVSPDFLVDHLWGENLPSNPRNSLQDLIRRLRIALEDHDHVTLITVRGDYGLFVDPDLVDTEVFKSLAGAGLSLVAAEPEAARLLLKRALQGAIGDLPDFRPDTRVAAQVEFLYELRTAAQVALEKVERNLSDAEWAEPIARSAWSVAGSPVGLALRLAELPDLALARLVGVVSEAGGRIHQLSNGLLVASYSGGAAALAAGVELTKPGARWAASLIGGAICHVSGGDDDTVTEELMRLSTEAERGQILVSDQVRSSVSSTRLSSQLTRLDDELWRLGEAAAERETVPDGRLRQPALVGREDALRDVVALVRSQRIVTLRGPGGIGKTRLAAAIREVLRDEITDGISQVNLAEVDRRSDAVASVVRGLGVVLQPYKRPVDVLIDRLRPSGRLIILDNCEEHADSVADLCRTLLANCPGLRLLATSRTSLGVPTEVVYDLGELTLPSAAALLVSLVQDDGGSLSPSEHHVIKLCSVLDCVPLAIECAASMVRSMGIEAVTMLFTSIPDGAFMPLLDAARGGRGRHPSIELALNVSYRLLPESDARFFECLSSLRGSFLTEDAAVAAEAGGAFDVEGVLRRLSSASLVQSLGGSRWRVLEPVRQFAATRLLRRGDQVAQATRHARYFAGLAQVAEPKLKGAEEGTWFKRLVEAYPNLSKAMSWLIETGDAENALRLTSSLWWFWAAQGMYVDGSQAVDRALAITGPASPLLRAKALIAASHLTWWAGDPRSTESYLREALELVGQSPQTDAASAGLAAWAHTGLAGARMWDGVQYERLKDHLHQGARLFREIGDMPGLGLNLVTHSGVAWHCGDDEGHFDRAVESLQVFESADHLTMIAHAHRVIGLACAGLGDTEGGLRELSRGLRMSEELGDSGGLPLGLCFLGLAEIWGGNREAAAEAFCRSIVANERVGQVWPALLAIAIAAEEAGLRNLPAECGRLTAVTYRIDCETGIRLPPRDRRRMGEVVDSVAQKLDPAEAERIKQEGVSMQLRQALVLAAEVLGSS